MSARAAGAASGVLAALALPPFHLWPFVFVALVPLGLRLSRADATPTDGVHAGLAYGACFYGLLLHWVPFTVAGLMPLGWLVGILGLVLLIGAAGVQGLLLRLLLADRPRGSLVAVLAVPAVWVSAELLIARAGPLAVPWTPLGLALARVPEVAGAAEWIGAGGLGFWIAAVNGTFLCALRSTRIRRGLSLTAVALVAVFLPSVAGIVRAESLPISAGTPLLVGRMDLPRRVLLDPDRRDAEAMEALGRMAPEARRRLESEAGPRPLLAVLPEAPFASPLGGRVETTLRRAADTLGLPLLAGVHVATDEGLRNAVVLVRSGEEVQVLHAKRRLVPGVERPGLVPGRGDALATVSDLGLALAVCFESAFGSDTRKARRRGAEILVNPTNDGWFVPRPFGGLSAAHLQHRAHLQLRAIEGRMGAVRSPVGGELLVIAPTGRVLTALPPGEGFVRVDVPRSRIVTTYVRLGDVAGPFAALLLVGMAALPGRRRSGPEPRVPGPVARE